MFLFGYTGATRDQEAPVQQELKIDNLVDALIEREGGYVRHPADRGGPTCFGITEAVARAHGYAGPMRQLPRSEAAAIYRRLYWARPRFDRVAERSAALAAELFDTGVNMGPSVAVTFLQRALTALNRNGRDYGNYILDKACQNPDPKALRRATLASLVRGSRATSRRSWTGSVLVSLNLML
jgi:lysozyme family protein